MKANNSTPKIGNGTERTPKEYWQDVKNARSFFDEFATEVGINPLRVEDWYTIELQQLLTKKVHICSFTLFPPPPQIS